MSGNERFLDDFWTVKIVENLSEKHRVDLFSGFASNKIAGVREVLYSLVGSIPLSKTTYARPEVTALCNFFESTNCNSVESLVFSCIHLILMRAAKKTASKSAGFSSRN